MGALDHRRVAVDAEHRAGGGDRGGERREVGARAAAEVDRAVAGAESEGVQHDPLVRAGQVHRRESFLVPDPVGHGRLEHALGDLCGGLQLPFQDLAAGGRQAQGALASGLVQGLDQVLGLQACQGAGEASASQALSGQLLDGRVDGVSVQGLASQCAQDEHLGVGGLRGRFSPGGVNPHNGTWRVLSGP